MVYPLLSWGGVPPQAAGWLAASGPPRLLRSHPSFPRRGKGSRLPPVAHPVHCVDLRERRIDRGEFPADALHVRGDRALVHDQVRIAHKTLAVFHVAGEFRERVHHPELGERQRDGLVFPRRGEALRVELQGPALEHFLDRLRLAQRIDPAKQRRDAREQVWQAHVLGEIVVRAQAQPRDRVEVRVARGEKKDRQAGSHGAELAAQRKAPVGLLAQADIDDGDAAGHGRWVIPSLERRGNKSALNIAHSFSARPPTGRAAIFPPQFFGSFPFFPPGGALFGRFNTRHGPKRALSQGDRRWKLRAAGPGYVRSSSIFSPRCSSPSASASPPPSFSGPARCSWRATRAARRRANRRPRRKRARRRSSSRSRIASSPSTPASSPSTARPLGPRNPTPDETRFPETSNDAGTLLRGRSAGFHVRDAGNRPTPASVFRRRELA